MVAAANVSRCVPHVPNLCIYLICVSIDVSYIINGPKFCLFSFIICVMPLWVLLCIPSSSNNVKDSAWKRQFPPPSIPTIFLPWCFRKSSAIIRLLSCLFDWNRCTKELDHQQMLHPMVCYVNLPAANPRYISTFVLYSCSYLVHIYLVILLGCNLRDVMLWLEIICASILAKTYVHTYICIHTS